MERTKTMVKSKTMEKRTIPVSILSKIGNYSIEIARNSVKVDVLDSAELISSRIDDKLPRELPVVGLDLHSGKTRRSGHSTNSLLVLCVDDYCLVVQLKYVDKIPGYLRRFLGNEKICFVGVDVDRKLSRGMPSSPDPLVCKTALELSHLAGRIRQDPSYCNSNLKALAAKENVSYEPPASGGCCGCRINNDARVFSEKQVKALVHDAYFCYKIAQKLVAPPTPPPPPLPPSPPPPPRNETTQETGEVSVA